MRSRLLNLPLPARATGFALVALAVVIAALHFQALTYCIEPRNENSSAASDSLEGVLKRSQLTMSNAENDAACKAAWPKNRHRFFTDAPARATQQAESRR